MIEMQFMIMISISIRRILTIMMIALIRTILIQVITNTKIIEITHIIKCMQRIDIMHINKYNKYFFAMW